MTWTRRSSECWLSWNRMTQTKQHTVRSSNIKLWKNKNQTTLSCFIILRVKLVLGRYIINYFTLFWSAFWIREKLMTKTIFKWMDHKTKSDENFLPSEMCVFCFPGWERLRIKMLLTVFITVLRIMLYNLKPLKAKLRHSKDFKGCFTAQINSESAADAVFVEWISASFTHAAAQEMKQTSVWLQSSSNLRCELASRQQTPTIPVQYDGWEPQRAASHPAVSSNTWRLPDRWREAFHPDLWPSAGSWSLFRGSFKQEQTDAARLISTQMINHSLTSYIMNECCLQPCSFSTWHNDDRSVIDY